MKGRGSMPRELPRSAQTGSMRTVKGTLSMKEERATDSHTSRARVAEGPSLRPASPLARSSSSPTFCAAPITTKIPRRKRRESQSNSLIILFALLPPSSRDPTPTPTPIRPGPRWRRGSRESRRMPAAKRTRGE